MPSSLPLWGRVGVGALPGARTGTLLRLEDGDAHLHCTDRVDQG
jgi:hypothetical protein